MEDWNTERRDELRKAHDLVEQVRKILWDASSAEDFEQARLCLEDVAADINGRIMSLTDDIGDERGDEYAVERSMHQARTI